VTTSFSSMLLVDDDPNDLLLLERALRKTGFEDALTAVNDGEAAVAFLSGKASPQKGRLPALILLDIKLPKLSGFEVLAWIRSQPGLRRMPVVFLTSSQDKHDVARAYELGANAYLIKPPGLNELVELMKAVAAFWIRANVYAEIAPAADSR
jgi:CheY-like chemotaxis protein